MIGSDWVVRMSVVVGDQGALVGRTDLPVPPDASGKGQQPLRDADPHASQRAPAVLLQPKLTFEALEGALDPLAPATQRPMPQRLVEAVRPQQPAAIAGDQLFELLTCEPLVGQDDQPGPQPVALVVQQG